MRIEVDQSGRIEYTRSPTVIAFSDTHQSAILILVADKLACIDRLRKRGETPEMIYYKLFVAAVFLRLEELELEAEVRKKLLKISFLPAGDEVGGEEKNWQQGEEEELRREYAKLNPVELQREMSRPKRD